MKIGEFAKACNMSVSSLRYYDSCGLLKPVYIDSFTGYRYYSEWQVDFCSRINELKEAGFPLAEIKRLLTADISSAEITAIFDSRKSRLCEILRRLDELQDIALGGNFMLKEKTELMHEDVHIPFENDERIVGRWEIIGEYNSRTEFDLGKRLADSDIGGKKRDIYFLPNGEWYWCYSWTKGKLLFENGESSFVNEYTLEKHNNSLYMFVKFKSYDFIQSGRTTLLVLRQCDNCKYSAQEIARKDNIDMPFVNDETVLGKWKAVAFVQSKEEFLPENITDDFMPYFKGINFLPNGECVSLYIDETIKSRDMQEWTNGCLLRKWNTTACAYEIRRISDREYMFLEWKSGDYRWGGFDTDYYVLVRE